ELAGTPPAADVYAGSRRLGVVYYSDDVAPIPAYSGHPVRMLIGLDTEARITGVDIVAHEEPILVVGIDEQALARYTRQYVGRLAVDRVKVGGESREGYFTVDGMSGATITTMVLNRSIMLSAHQVAEAHGLLGAQGPAVRAGNEPDPLLDPTWQYVWRAKRVETLVLATGLVFLLGVLVFQDWLARRPRALAAIREGMLLFTLLFIGWYALAQLSVINVLTFLHAFVQGFRWDTFLVDPQMFILWGFVAVTIILWGRGVYCGWLCPFGALQELVFQLARKLGLPAFELPQIVHERLLAVKYVIAIMLFGISLGSLEQAARFAEIEPFKTAITLRFDRPWPYVAWAGTLIVVAAFMRKFYCRYLCPLGAALTFPGRFRIFDWLRRRKECGRPCQTCASECEVRAIRPTGEIDANECHYCLDCQVTYWNDRRCPPLVERRRRSERRRSWRDAPGADDPQAPPSGAVPREEAAGG
ncbi:MAG: 4Fe-4S binding protein, partial [Rhodocyclaceae bacterium]|nr:4Fe-4S binding protein [Rhodocyclaceae bacterium]